MKTMMCGAIADARALTGTLGILDGAAGDAGALEEFAAEQALTTRQPIAAARQTTTRRVRLAHSPGTQLERPAARRTSMDASVGVARYERRSASRRRCRRPGAGASRPESGPPGVHGGFGAPRRAARRNAAAGLGSLAAADPLDRHGPPARRRVHDDRLRSRRWPPSKRFTRGRSWIPGATRPSRSRCTW